MSKLLNLKNGFSQKSPKPKTQLIYQPKTEEMKWVFDKYDKNRDGKISRQEYESAVREMGKKGITTGRNEAGKAFQVMDSNGDGYVDFNEFMENSSAGVNAGDIRSAFEVFDLDGNGKISAEELVKVMKMMGENCSLSHCRKIVRAVDSDGDGMIDMDEFMNMMTRTMKSV